MSTPTSYQVTLTPEHLGRLLYAIGRQIEFRFRNRHLWLRTTPGLPPDTRRHVANLHQLRQLIHTHRALSQATPRYAASHPSL